MNVDIQLLALPIHVSIVNAMFLLRSYTYILIKHTQTYIYILKKILKPPGVILETEGSVQKIQKGALFHSKKVKKGNPNLTFPYVHSLYTIVLMK